MESSLTTINYGNHFQTLKKKYDVDTEVFLSLLQMFRAQGKSIVEAVKLVFEQY